ncbi:hypothetical protein FACS1894211_04670 [Clostridia bacterium]|nr:hypothetical protein FACS1894211_04670 [Clostridia bacterium]
MNQRNRGIFKALLLASAVVFAAFAFAACGGDKETGGVKTISIAVPDGAPILSIAKMRAENYAVENGYKTEWTTLNADTLTAQMMQSAPDIAVAPINLGAKMYNEAEDHGYRFAGVSIWGIMHLVSDDPVFDNAPDNQARMDILKGKTVYAFTESGTPGITLRHLLNQYGIAGEVTVTYLNGPSDVLEAIKEDKDKGIIHYAVLAEPVATQAAGASQRPGFVPKINFQTLWKEKHGDQMYPQAGLFFHKRLLEKDKAFLDKFISMAALSTDWAFNNPKEAGDLAKNVLNSAAIPGGGPVKIAVDAGRLPLNFTYAAEAKAAVNAYLEIIKNDSANSVNLIGGKVPDENFYYSKG